MVAPNGEVVGVEVLFITDAVEKESVERLRAVGLRELTEEEMIALWRTQTAGPELQERAKQNDLFLRRAFSEAYEELVPHLHPAEEAVAKVLGEMQVQGGVAVGDPCYGGASLTMEIPAGRYVAVAWMLDLGVWGTRVGRIGLYRTGSWRSTPCRDVSVSPVRKGGEESAERLS